MYVFVWIGYAYPVLAHVRRQMTLMRSMLYTLLALKAKAPPVHSQSPYSATAYRNGELVRPSSNMKQTV